MFSIRTTPKANATAAGYFGFVPGILHDNRYTIGFSEYFPYTIHENEKPRTVYLIVETIKSCVFKLVSAVVSVNAA